MYDFTRHAMPVPQSAIYEHGLSESVGEEEAYRNAGWWAFNDWTLTPRQVRSHAGGELLLVVATDAHGKVWAVMEASMPDLSGLADANIPELAGALASAMADRA